MRIFFTITILTVFTFVSSALHPKKEYTVLPKHVELSHEEIKITTNDNAILNAWYFDNNSNHLVIMSHNGDGNMSDYFRHIKTFCDQGFNVMAYDYRGYGASSEFDINQYQYTYTEFYSDFKAVLSYCQNKFRQDIIAYGWGIGGGISLSVAYQKDGVSGIIADDPFYSYKVTHHALSKMNAIMSFPIEIEKGHYDIKHLKPGKNLERVLIFHGSNNYLYTYEDLKHLSHLQKINKEDIYTINRKNYHMSFGKGSLYNQKVYEFILSF